MLLTSRAISNIQDTTRFIIIAQPDCIILKIIVHTSYPQPNLWTTPRPMDHPMDHLFFEGWSTKKPLRDKAQFPWTTLYHLFSLKEYDIYIFLWGPLRRGGFRWSTKSISICRKGFSGIGVVHRGGGGPQTASLMVVSTIRGFFCTYKTKYVIVLV